MKKLLVLAMILGSTFSLIAQDSAQLARQDSIIKATSPKAKKKDWSKVNIANRSGDHFMIQFGLNTWTQAPDSIKTKGLSRTINVYLMYDLPFKTDPRFSVGLGVGVGGDNVYFDKTYIDISGKVRNRLAFDDVSDTTHFKKFKLATTYLEVPLELRFTANPENYNRSWKLALGAKVGTMVQAITKGKTWQNSQGQTLNAYTQKERSKRFFNTTRLAVTGRIGYGIFNVFASYQFNAFVKEGFGPEIRPLQIGLAISGL